MILCACPAQRIHARQEFLDWDQSLLADFDHIRDNCRLAVKTYHDHWREAGFVDGGPPRTHPWNDAEAPGARYVDFVEHPELIGESLEDFLLFSHLDTVQEFFNLIRHANRTDGLQETNDCA